jgi:hypothetical protein
VKGDQPPSVTSGWLRARDLLHLSADGGEVFVTVIANIMSDFLAVEEIFGEDVTFEEALLKLRDVYPVRKSVHLAHRAAVRWVVGSREREREREWTWWAHTGGGNALAFKPPPNTTSWGITFEQHSVQLRNTVLWPGPAVLYGA